MGDRHRHCGGAKVRLFSHLFLPSFTTGELVQNHKYTITHGNNPDWRWEHNVTFVLMSEQVCVVLHVCFRELNVRGLNLLTSLQHSDGSKKIHSRSMSPLFFECTHKFLMVYQSVVEICPQRVRTNRIYRWIDG